MLPCVKTPILCGCGKSSKTYYPFAVVSDLLVVGLLVQGLAVVKHLLRGKQSDADILENLADLLAESPEEHANVLSHDKCTGASQHPWLLTLAAKFMVLPHSCVW